MWRDDKPPPYTNQKLDMKPIDEGDAELSDGRKPWDWKSRYPQDAQHQVKWEAIILGIALAVTLMLAGVFLGLDAQHTSIDVHGLSIQIQFQLLATFFTGCVGGVTFSIKWLVHAVAKGRWHQDRQYWRFMVPMMGGVYACVVLALWDIGLVPSQSQQGTETIHSVAPIAFLVGYFSDGVSGLLSNIANAVFGTVKKK